MGFRGLCGRRRDPIRMPEAPALPEHLGILTLKYFGQTARYTFTASRSPPQWRPATKIGAEMSFISTKLPPPMSRR